MPDLPGAALGITSDGFFALGELPGSVAIVGSGYVAAELSGVFAALGSRVTIVARHERILRSFDEMLSARLMAAMQADGIEILTVGARRSNRAGRRRAAPRARGRPHVRSLRLRDLGRSGAGR